MRQLRVNARAIRRQIVHQHAVLLECSQFCCLRPKELVVAMYVSVGS